MLNFLSKKSNFFKTLPKKGVCHCAPDPSLPFDGLEVWIR